MARFPSLDPMDPSPIGGGYVQPWAQAHLLRDIAWRRCLAEAAEVVGARRRGALVLVEGMPLALAAALAVEHFSTSPWDSWQRRRQVRCLETYALLDEAAIGLLATRGQLAVVWSGLFHDRRLWQLAPRSTGHLLA
jgi:hypothetical protein